MKRAWLRSAAIGMAAEFGLLVVLGTSLDILHSIRRDIPVTSFDRVIFSEWIPVAAAAILPAINAARRKWPAFWGNFAGIVLVLLCIVLLLWFVSIVAPH